MRLFNIQENICAWDFPMAYEGYGG